MNIFRHHYNTIKLYLKIFGEKVNSYHVDLKVKYTTEFWKEVFNCAIKENNKKSWECVISEYFIYCDVEKRMFIDLHFFQSQKSIFVQNEMPLSDKSCRLWSEEILNSIAGLAIQAKLLVIDIIKLKENAKKYEKIFDNEFFKASEDVAIESILTDEEWSEIEPLIPRQIRKNVNFPSQRKRIEAMIFIFKSNTRWQDLPMHYGSWKTIYNNFLYLRDNGIWNEIVQIVDKRDLASYKNWH